MDFRILGRLEVLDGGVDIAPRRAQPRALLATFLLHPNELVTTDRLIEALWGETQPATADKAIQGHVSALRKALGHERLVTERGGYRLVVLPGELDTERFASAVASVAGEARPEIRARALAAALTAWRGEPIAELDRTRTAQAAIARLEALHLGALEAWGEAEVAAGRHATVLADLERAVAEHPLSEGLRASLMLALYRAGRQADALRAYREGRRKLAEELGIEPGAALQALEQRILSHDPALDLGPAAGAIRAAARQERKSITVIVVEVTQEGTSDPEDFERTVGPALDRIRARMEQLGGRAEPVFANALLGIFGAPRAHDDDPLRAVRAGLELLSAFAGGELRLRGGIETGEALVTIDGDDVAVTGHVLGAASRLQARAPLGSILVGPGAQRATQDAVDYVGAEASAWIAQRVRRSDEMVRAEPPFIGRTGEIGQLERVFARARDGRSVQLVTITAEPGGGKSRLVRELRARVEAVEDASRARWLQGRSLPYGTGLTFWALGEVVRDWAAILESDDAATSGEKLGAAISALERDDERKTWLVRSTAPLVGIDDATPPGNREQAFAAWRHLVEGIAAERQLVLAFEDIHWAGDALLDFLDHLVERTADVPLLVLCTARPELLDARPTWGAGKRNATAILLQPLSEADTGALLEALLGRPPSPDTVRRAGGNPLYAHELARLAANPGADTSSIPASLRAVIAAHLDVLSPELKAIAANASVVGEVFWPGAVAEIGGIDVEAVATQLQRLVASEVVRRRRRSAVAGEDEFEFLHVLVRDVAYEQIPRRDRIQKHQAAAAWIERLAHGRPTAHAELASHHHALALQLAEGLGLHEQVPDLRSRATTSLAAAGDAARTMDVVKAAGHYRRALDLMASDDPGRGTLLARLGDVAGLSGDLVEAEWLALAAIEALRADGDTMAAATAMVTLEAVQWRLGRAEAARRRLLGDAIELLEALPPSPELVHAYAQTAAHELYAGLAAECLAWSSRALAVADQLGLQALQFQPRHYLGIARFEQGDEHGIADVRSAIRIGLQTGLAWETAHAQADLGAMVWLQEGPDAAIPLKLDAAAFAETRGMAALAETTRAQILWMQYDAGDWDAMLEAAAGLVAAAADRRGRVTTMAMSATARVLVGRGRTREATALESDVVGQGRAIGDVQDAGPALATVAYIRSAAGDGPGALGLIAEMEERSRGRDLSRRAHDLALVARICLAHGAADLARSFLPKTDVPAPTRAKLAVATARAIVGEATGDIDAAGRGYARVASGWSAYGSIEEEAHALLGLARCRAAKGHRPDTGSVNRAKQLGHALGAVGIVDAAREFLELSAQ